MERNHNTPVPPANDLRQLFRVHSILTLDELKSALGTQVAMTVFRKLRPLAYLSSYSHRGKYYTLNEIARFDQFGLWSHHQVRFSRHRTLINTCAVLVADSEAGYSADELEHLLHVQVKDPLRKLALQGRIRRSKVGLRWVHFSADSKHYHAQLRARHIAESASTAPSVSSVGRVVVSDVDSRADSRIISERRAEEFPHSAHAARGTSATAGRSVWSTWMGGWWSERQVVIIGEVLEGGC